MSTVSKDRTTWVRPFLAALATALAGCCLCGPANPTASTDSTGNGASVPAKMLGAGAAKVPVVLGSGIPLAGFGGSPRRLFNLTTIPLNLAAMSGSCVDPDPSTAFTFFEPNAGTTDAIMARALVLTNGVRKMAIVKLDTIGSSRRLRDDLAVVAARLGIAAENFLLVATHTHSGPGAVSEYTAFQLAGSDCFAPPVYQALRTAATKALELANASVQPAALGIGTTPSVTGASRNRRQRPAIVDQELGLVRIMTASGKPLAALFNFAVHGTCFGSSNMRFSADCMGGMERTVETGLPGAIAIFTNGAEGDVAPEHTGPSGVTLEGQIVGNAVLALWPTITTKSWVELRGAYQLVRMPSPRFNPAGCMPVAGTGGKTLCDVVPGFQLTTPLPASWVPTHLPFQALRIDDTVFAAIPGEPITEIGWDLKNRAKAKGFTRGFVLGLANDHGGYFTTLAEYQRGQYEGTATVYGPTTGQVVVNSADLVMTAVQ